MDEIRIFYSSDKAVVAQRLQAALNETGYSAGLEAVAAGDGDAIVEQGRGAAAALLVWSRELAGSAVLDGWLARLRALPNLIELSSDGIAPQAGDESRIILLSGWRGQPFHQGWQRLQTKLGALTRPQAATARPAPVIDDPALPTAAAKSAPAGTAPSPPARGRRLAAFAFAVLGAIIAIGVAGALLVRAGHDARHGGVSEAVVSAPASPPLAQQAPAPAPAPAPATVPGPADSASAAPEAAIEPATAAPQPPSAVNGTPARAPAAAQRPAAPRRVVRAAPARARAQIPIKHYSKRNSRTMRLFCAGAGRYTPQCVIFRRSTGG